MKLTIIISLGKKKNTVNGELFSLSHFFFTLSLKGSPWFYSQPFIEIGTTTRLRRTSSLFFLYIFFCLFFVLFLLFGLIFSFLFILFCLDLDDPKEIYFVSDMYLFAPSWWGTRISPLSWDFRLFFWTQTLANSMVLMAVSRVSRRKIAGSLWMPEES